MLGAVSGLLNFKKEKKGGVRGHLNTMEKQKTVIQQMIDFVTSEEYPHLYTAVKDEWFKTFLEKEKQQIIDAYNSGDYMSSAKERLDYDEADHKYKNGEQYYEQLVDK